MYVSCEANTWFCKKEPEAEHDCKTVAKVEMAWKQKQDGRQAYPKPNPKGWSVRD